MAKKCKDCIWKCRLYRITKKESEAEDCQYYAREITHKKIKRV